MRDANTATVPQLGRTQRYQRLGPLASGGMGTVYLGRMTAGGTTRTVAMKVMHPHLADNTDMVAMFLDEARVATRLRHPNVVGVLDMDMLGDELVIVMEYVEGITLAEMQSALRLRGKELPIGFAARIVSDALTGLHEVHELLDEKSEPLGLVHRDVSPHNLLIGSDGVTRVTDFGIALAAGRLATTRPDGTVKGKLQYLSPEQVGRKPVDRRVDVFAAGIVLWECLTYCATGQRLFEAPTEAETVTRVLRDPIAPPSMTRPEISLELDEVCLKALERDPERRYRTAAEFGEALRSAIGPLPGAAEVGALVFDLASKPILHQREALDRASLVLSSPRDQKKRRPSLPLAAAAAVCGLAGATLLVFFPRTHTGAVAEPTRPPPVSATIPETPAAPAVSIASATPTAQPAPADSNGALPERTRALNERNATGRNAGNRAAPARHTKPSRPFMPEDL